MGGLGAFLKGLLRRERIASPDDVQRFMAQRAAFIAQKCVIEYCRARAGINWQRLFSEEPFQRAVHAAAWRAWALTLCDVTQMLHALLRPHVPSEEEQALLDALEHLAMRVIAGETARQPLPAQLPASFVQDTKERLRALLRELRGSTPLPVKDIPRARAKELFDIIPIHADLKAPDEDYVFNTLRVYLVRAADDLRAAADMPALARALSENAPRGKD